MSHAEQPVLAGKRLVVFGCGYVGTQVAREALQRGMRVAAVTRNETKAAVLGAEGIDVIVADLAGDAWHAQIAEGADFALNCVSSGGGGLDGYRHSYRGGMSSVVAWARKRGGLGTIVYTGSTSVYPQGGGVTVTETAATDDVGERGQILLEAEKILQANEGACSRWFVLRLAGIYGPERHHLLDQVRIGEVAGRGDYRLNLIFRDDISAGVWAAFGAGASVRNEVFNLADDGAATKAEIAAWLARRLGLAAVRFSGEPAAGRRVVTPDRVIVNAKAKTLLGWQPVCASFREGYEKILSR